MAAVSAGTVATRASWRTEDGKMHGVNVFMARVTAARRFTCHAWCCVTPPRQRGGRELPGSCWSTGRHAPRTAAGVPSAVRTGPRRSGCTGAGRRQAGTGACQGSGTRLGSERDAFPRCLAPPAVAGTHVFEEEVVPVPEVLPAHASQQVLDLGGGQRGGANDQRLPELGAPGHHPGGRLKHAARAATSHVEWAGGSTHNQRQKASR